jgi:hypothetical protein
MPLKHFTAVAILLLSAQYSIAQDAEVCQGVLIPTEEQAQSDYRRMQAYLFTNAEAEYERLQSMDANKRGAEASYKLFSAEYNDSQTKQSFSDKIRRRLISEGFSLNESDARAYTRRGLTDKQVQGWLDCVIIRTQAGLILLSPRAITSDGFVLSVARRFPNGVSGGEAEISVKGGTIGSQQHLKDRYAGSGTKSYDIRANSNSEQVTVIANLPGFSDVISVDLKAKPVSPPSQITKVQEPVELYRLLTKPKGDCKERKFKLQDVSRGKSLDISVKGANASITNCTWIDWTGTNAQVANSIAVAIGLEGSNYRYALVSYTGDCNSRMFTILDKKNSKLLKIKVRNNCGTINFTAPPAQVAEQVCKVAACE